MKRDTIKSRLAHRCLKEFHLGANKKISLGRDFT